MTSTPLNPDPQSDPNSDPDNFPGSVPDNPDSTGIPDDPDQAQPDIVTDPNE